MRKKLRVLLAGFMAATAALGLSGRALALPFFPQEAATAGAVRSAEQIAFEGRAYHGNQAECAMTAQQARALAEKLAQLMQEEHHDAYYMDGFEQYAALLDLGNGIPALYYYEGVCESRSDNPYGPGFNGSVSWGTAYGSAWEFKDGELVQFSPGWFYGDYMVYENLSGNGRSGGTYVVPIVDGVVDIYPDEDWGTWVDASQSTAWYEWYLGSYGENYEDAYEDMYAGPNNEYESVLQNPREGCAAGLWEESFVGLEDAIRIWSALNTYAFESEAQEASDPAALLPAQGEANLDGLTPELLRGYAQTLRDLPDIRVNEYSGGSDPVVNFATLVFGEDGTALLWVVPALMSDDWWGNEQYFSSGGASFVGLEHRVFGWDGTDVTSLGDPGADQVRLWPDGIEFMELYSGTDVDGQNWETLYAIENGGLAAAPRWCHAYGWLYEYALEDAGVYGQIPQDLDARRAETRSFVEYKIRSGLWPDLPLDWDSFSTENYMEDCIDFDVYGGEYEAFRQAHEIYDADYDYTYLDMSQSVSFMDIQDSPENWLFAGDLAAVLERLADSLDVPDEPPVGDVDPEDGGDDVEDGQETGEDEEREDDSRPSASENEKDEKEFPTLLVAGIAAGAVAVGGGIGAAVALISRKHRGKAAASETREAAAAIPISQPANGVPVSPAQASSGTQPMAKVPSFCSSCGAKLNPGAKFCSKCGNKL